LAVTQRNSDVMMILMYLYKLVQIFEDYFKTLEEESIRDNFVIIYELLDETMDFGYPQSTESSLLKQYITQKSHELDKSQVTVPPEVTGSVLRTKNVQYSKNEVFLDVIEELNILISSNGEVLRSEILGKIKVRSYLSGFPELKLGLNDVFQVDTSQRKKNLKDDDKEDPQPRKPVEMEDVSFHQCVNLTRFEKDGLIIFVPPDGDFELLTYRLSTNVKPLIMVEPVVDNHGSKIDYLIKIKSQFRNNCVANEVHIVVPVPQFATTPKFRTSIGSVVYDPENDSMVWKIKQLQGGGRDHFVRAQFSIPSVSVEETKSRKQQPINIKFEIPYFTVSGLQVRYLKIIEKQLEEKYTAMPWVRYITKAGDYQIRL